MQISSQWRGGGVRVEQWSTKQLYNLIWEALNHHQMPPMSGGITKYYLYSTFDLPWSYTRGYRYAIPHTNDAIKSGTLWYTIKLLY